jgi:DNA replication initiation complex subunit (GINS family)|tara:strand:+ start:3861 stop:4496 length:636 start_codon:yes stop_codon:yes gene_type:complete
MEAKEVNITYEVLFELLKREKDTADLQKLEPNFFNDFVDYLNEKKNMLGKEDTLFSYDEKKKTEKQIENAKRIIKEIYERREKKILNIALLKSRTKSNVIDTSSLLENEKRFLDEVVKVLDIFRNDVIANVIDGKHASEITMKKEEMDEKDNEPKEEKGTKLVRFLCSVPKFVGKELEEYGPFAEEDIANLPAEIAAVLISKGRVEEIKEN